MRTRATPMTQTVVEERERVGKPALGTPTTSTAQAKVQNPGTTNTTVNSTQGYYTNSGYGSSRRTTEDKGGGRGKGYHHQAYKGNDASAARQQTQAYEGHSRSENGGRKRGSDQQDVSHYSALTQLQGNSKDRRLNGRDPN